MQTFRPDSYGGRLSDEPVHRLRRVLSLVAPAVFDGMNRSLCREFFKMGVYITWVLMIDQ